MHVRLILSLCFMVLTLGYATGQNNLCAGADPFCTDTLYNFPAGVNAGTAEVGANYGCLYSQPNPAWYFMQIGTAGPIQITMNSVPAVDIDFACWGPFASATAPCVAMLTANGTPPSDPNPGPNANYPSAAMIDCSYSINPTEYCYIPNGIVGQYYILLITNYSNQPCNILFSQTSGGGATDCGILAPPVVGDTVCVGETVQLTVNSPTPGATYNWTGPNGFTSNTMNPTIPNASPATAGTYSLTITVGTQTSPPVTCTVVVNPNPTITITPVNPSTCNGVPVDILANSTGPNTTYLWNNTSTNNPLSVNPSATAAYSVTGTDANGCSGTAMVTVTVYNGPNLQIYQTKSALCKGDTCTLIVTGGSNIAWNPLYGLSSPTGSVVIASPLTTMTYTVTGDNNGCVGTGQVTVAVIPIPGIDFSADRTEGCNGFWVTFTDLTNPPVNNWYWNFGDIGEDNNISTLAQPSHYYGNPGSFDVTLNVVSDEGCGATMTFPQMIVVHKNPIASFIYNPMVVPELDPIVYFSDQSINADSWAWNFGELYYLGNQSDQQNPIHTFSGVGTFNVMLAVENVFGCADTAIKQVVVEPNIDFYVPNSFTPNGDGHNDVFFTIGLGIDESTFEFRIFDRWGQQVFFTPDVNKAWDGTIQDQEDIAPPGVYAYEIYFRDVKENQHKYKGTINLIR